MEGTVEDPGSMTSDGRSVKGKVTFDERAHITDVSYHFFKKNPGCLILLKFLLLLIPPMLVGFLIISTSLTR